MSGGSGGMIQTVFGLIVIGVINNSLSLLGVSSYWQTVAMGCIIILAVVMDKNRKEVQVSFMRGLTKVSFINYVLAPLPQGAFLL